MNLSHPFRSVSSSFRWRSALSCLIVVYGPAGSSGEENEGRGRGEKGDVEEVVVVVVEHGVSVSSMFVVVVWLGIRVVVVGAVFVSSSKSAVAS